MKKTLRLALLCTCIVALGIISSCSKDREQDWKCACPEGIPSTDPNIGTMGEQTFRYNTVTEDVAYARCKEESKGRIKECVLSKVE